MTIFLCVGVRYSGTSRSSFFTRSDEKFVHLTTVIFLNLNLSFHSTEEVLSKWSNQK